jgi:hypothetical protein
MTEPRRHSARTVLLLMGAMALPLLVAVVVGVIRGPDPSRSGGSGAGDGGINIDASVAFAVTGLVVAAFVAAPFVLRALRKRRG